MNTRREVKTESKSFAYWLQGFFEISDSTNEPSGGLTAQQVECIKRHLALVFKHEIDPSYGDKEHQDELNEIHNKINKLEQKTDDLKKRQPISISPKEPTYRC